MIKRKSYASKWLVMLELVFAAGAIFYLYLFSKPGLISPAPGLVIRDFDFNFEIENAEKIVVSRDVGFEDIIVIEKGREVILIPGTYYWKAVSFLRESEVRNFTITTSLVLTLEDKGDVYEIVNRGNVPAEIRQNQNILGIIPPKDASGFPKEDSKNFSGNDSYSTEGDFNFEGRQA